jgi:type IV secretion system protein VirD4
LNQIGRRLTESLEAHGNSKRRQLLLMLDEFPALGRLDFFESALAFMAGYGLRAFLIAQSLNQIEKAYGPNNAILDNCHVRIAFATNDERTAKRISDALGTATELRAQRNYAGHRLSPWLGHLMVSRQETARPLLTPGEVMQLPQDEEVVMVAGCPPIRAKKLKYYHDGNFIPRILRPPVLEAGQYKDRPITRSTDDTTAWRMTAAVNKQPFQAGDGTMNGSATGGSLSVVADDDTVRQPVFNTPPTEELSWLIDDGHSDAERERIEGEKAPFKSIAPLASLDTQDGLSL